MSRIINRLPPLPPPRTWYIHFPSKYLPNSPDRNMIRKSTGRKLLANPKICDDFVRSLNMREGEVVIDAYSGVGSLTRSLLSGGKSQRESKQWSPALLEEMDEVPVEGGSKKSKVKKQKYPSWLEDLPASPSSTTSTQQNSSEETETEQPIKPKLVVSSEGSLELLVRSFNYPSKSVNPLSTIGKEISQDPYTRPVPVITTPLHPNLLLSHSTAYVWPTLPKILENPLVQNALPVHNPELPPGDAEAYKRNWEDPEPPITIVCQMPDSSIGEQLASQWVGSAVGDPGQKRTWIWEWGRVRMALLCGKSLYDRILAPPGSVIHCKLSILAQALFDIVPLPPYHHVLNVDKQSKFTHDRPSKPLSSVPPSSTTPTGIPSNPPSSIDSFTRPEHGQKTLTYPLDFYPPVTSAQRLIGKPLERPDLLGLMLIPKLNSPILSSQKDTWDYCMRRLFVRDTLTLKAAIPNLSFGAETLLTHIEESSTEKFRGVPVDGRRVIRDLRVEEWLRIVDVFDKWAFKPDNLILDSGSPDETSREVGQD
ncbi:hypothetical protein I302_105151 [Kwoniella bestiolae CBS 10118]|uniref:rRNA adenine N(6)-methyltransferase n=1 Tax=Kwoniella bestiolae CBS 10118 TaxID=1296100 RepID=A0A1B9FSB8_9TREE|nr:hypothetical protein I302_08439 [Kwoniella bestiolae CBS 10118]OCF21662.1 hypothetical protein I302_08439 [Kwoniella bestiolae CBS 10118]